MAMGNTDGSMDILMKALGLRIISTVKERTVGLMGVNTQANGKITNCMAEVCTLGQMGDATRVNT